MKAWYFAPALRHYCCIKVVTDTGAVRITDTFKFLHHTFPVPSVTSTNHIVKAAKHLHDTINGTTSTVPDKLQAINKMTGTFIFIKIFDFMCVAGLIFTHN